MASKGCPLGWGYLCGGWSVGGWSTGGVETNGDGAEARL